MLSVRYLSILLLVLMPLQSVWAVVATYDGHELHTQDQHFGHHDGQHGGTATAESGDGSSVTGEADANHCHGHFAAAIMTVSAIPVSPTSRLTTRRTRIDWGSTLLSPPERPQWESHA